MKKVQFYTVANDVENVTLRSQLAGLHGDSFQEITCSPSVQDWVETPFLRDQAGFRHVGPTGIREYIVNQDHNGRR